ncbi:hemerythrin domain-containing protein [Noviherbaspirillum sp. CPCC 100848]|uniref:Hemerythrin domain-containing protein n=1 Tax=Noviherbaspirillum album TaxID=3080276 RepID=A0ABU6JKG5_9BURK|nr:hemerythrin domain-containing protein [Noviherbaspirillum sp. CPCC 100848]MEC4723644.1 hemerythrin domain-containing protein [Noviherbaspirillum sp. CPCC 100848]
MGTLFDKLLSDHGRCERHLEALSKSVADKDWNLAAQYCAHFSESFIGHIEEEESSFFSCLRQSVKGCDWFLDDLRMDHVRLKALLTRMLQAVHDKNAEGFYLHAESLLILMRDHSVKEEDILYPAVQRRLQNETHEAVRKTSCAPQQREPS